MIDWDRTHDWEILKYFHYLMRVTIRFGQAPPSIAELVALRRCCPQFRDEAPAELRKRIGAAGEISMGVLSTLEAHRLIEQVQRQGLRVVTEGASYISYQPIDRTTGSALLVENATEADAVVQAMLAAGVPVSEVIVD